MAILEWLAETVLAGVVTKLGGPVLGPMACIGGGAVMLIDKEFTEADIAALSQGRKRNGGCTHILLAFSSQTFSEGKTGEANEGNRAKTIAHGKRFTYSDIGRVFWHPSIKFCPAGQVSNVYIGSKEPIPETPASRGPTLSAALVTGKVSCPLCRASVLEQMKELERYRNTGQ